MRSIAIEASAAAVVQLYQHRSLCVLYPNMVKSTTAKDVYKWYYSSMVRESTTFTNPHAQPHITLGGFRYSKRAKTLKLKKFSFSIFVDLFRMKA
jgi:hypothetical protein